MVAIEYNWLFGAERAVTIPYSAEFDLNAIGSRGYRGASLAALAHLGRAKGYRLVATERINAFFLRNDLGPDIREIDVARGYRAPLNITRGKNVFDKIAQGRAAARRRRHRPLRAPSPSCFLSEGVRHDRGGFSS